MATSRNRSPQRIVASPKNYYNQTVSKISRPHLQFPFTRWVFNALFRLLTRRTFDGIENLPGSPPYIVVANHLSYFDAPLLFTALEVPRITGWAAEKYEHHPLFGPFVSLHGGVFIERGKVDRRALSAAVDRLQSGYVFGIAPEGTRSKTGALARGKTGTAYLAHEANVPIVPTAVVGTDKALRTLLRLRRPRVGVRIGKPFRLPPLNEATRAADLRRNTDEIMCRIAALLPPSYRGVYADHPRLKELLDDAASQAQVTR
jgi:1-acyl-sn-glycerol-3-phosphate acyltransferase